MRQLCSSMICATALLISLPAAAVDDGTKEAPPAEDGASQSVTYSGIGVSRVSADFENVKDAVNLNVVLGFRIPTLPVFGVELELSTTVIPGQVDSQNCTSTPGSGGLPIFGGGSESTTNCTSARNDFGTNGAGIYAAFRTPGKFYVMGKAGYRYVTTSLSELDEERSGDAYAGGVGYRWNLRKNSGVELYYNKYAERLDYYGFNIAYGFGGRD